MSAQSRHRASHAKWVQMIQLWTHDRDTGRPGDSQDGAEESERSQDYHKDVTHPLWYALYYNHTYLQSHMEIFCFPENVLA